MALHTLPLECKYVTEESVREWKNAASNFKLQNLPQPFQPSRFIYELCWTMVRGDLAYSKFRIALESVDFFEKEDREDVSSVVADTIAHMSQELSLPGEYRSRLIELAKWLVESALVPVRLLQERCEAEFLWESEMIKIKAVELKAKEVRVNTRLLYQQTKFNLLREESEGYAKLVTLLCQLDSFDLTERASCATISTIKSLIGHFDLDPNRVFDIVLECSELQTENDAFFELIPIFPKSHAAHILGFKFQYYQRLEVNDTVLDSLYRLTANLVKKEFIDLDSIYVHLLPKDEEAFEHYEEFSKKRLDEANKIGKINLAAIGKDLMEEEKPGDVTTDLFVALDMEIETVNERLPEIASNQKLGLLKGFLDVSDWNHTHILLERLSPLNPVEHKPICDGLMRFIERYISPAYALVRPTNLLNNTTSRHGEYNTNLEVLSMQSGQIPFIDLPKELFEILGCIGPYLHRNTILLQKVCRVLKAYYFSALSLVSNSSGSQEQVETLDVRDPRIRFKEARLNIEEALGTCLLPSLQLIPANPAIGLEIWEVLSLLPYETRYRLYGEWERDDERNPLILTARSTAKLDTRRILKRLAKENLKQLGRMVAKIAHANPMTVLRTIVHQIEAYRDMIAPVVDAFKYLTQLEYDILEYVVIERLAQGGREKLKEDGLNLSDWLQSLASFWGHLCKKYPSMELRGLFQYLVNQLKRGQGIELVLLQELIQQMANIQYTENMTEDQLDALAGGEALRYQATSFGITKNNKALIKSTNRLRDSLLSKDDPKLAVPLLLLIAQYRSMVVIKADAPYIKMVSEHFDRCHGTLLQYVDFLISAVTPFSSYAQLIPTLDELVQKYHLDPEVAFLIYRPIMRLFKPSKDSENSWPGNMLKRLSHAEKELSSSSDLVLDIGTDKNLRWSELIATVHSMLPIKAWNSLSPELYLTFWGLTLYDLYVPRKRYETEIAKQQAALRSLGDISDNSHTAVAKRKKDKERIQELLERLSCELQKQEQNVASVHQMLVHKKDSWLTSCPDSLKINMEFLQRCIFPRCVLSMTDAVYCAKFVHTLHSLGTPFFNTVNHIDVLICKALPPMICCCTEYEAGRLGRFLYETLKMAYHWKSDESVYEKECGNMPGFAVYYRDPNSQRVTFAQYIKVHWKWSGRITRLLIQCLESNEYMDIRNALIILTKISGVFPVTRKSGINLERRVSKIKADEREDLKVLATGVAAALAARKSSWISEEEFNMGYTDIKPSTGATSGGPSSSSVPVSQIDPSGTRAVVTNGSSGDVGAAGSEHVARSAKRSNETSIDSRHERSEIIGTNSKSEHQPMAKSVPATGHIEIHNAVNVGSSQGNIHKSSSHGTVRKEDDSRKVSDSHLATAGARHDNSSRKDTSKPAAQESEPRSVTKRASQSSSKSVKDDSKSVKISGRSTPGGATADKDSVRVSETQQSGSIVVSNGAHASASDKLLSNSVKGQETVTTVEPTKTVDTKASGDHAIHGNEGNDTSTSTLPGLHEDSSQRTSDDKHLKRLHMNEDSERSTKRRKGDNEDKSSEHSDIRGSDQRSVDKSRGMDQEKSGPEDQNKEKVQERSTDKGKEKPVEKADRDHRGERSDRGEKSRSDDHLVEKTRDRSLERLRERSVDKGQERADRNNDRSGEKNKDEKSKDDHSKARYAEPTIDKLHADDRFPMQNLPPPPPLPPNIVPQSLPVGRREEETERRTPTSRTVQRASPRHEEKSEKRRSEETSVSSLDEAKRRRDDEYRKGEKEKEKNNVLKETEASVASKRRRIKREHLSSEAPANYGPSPSQGPPISITLSQPFDSRERERKEPLQQRGTYIEEGAYDKGSRVHKDAGKVPRRDHDLPYNREWEDEKRQRNDPKRRHHRK